MADVTTRDGFIYLLPSPSGGEVLGLASLKDGVLELFLGPVGKQELRMKKTAWGRGDRTWPHCRYSRRVRTSLGCPTDAVSKAVAASQEDPYWANSKETCNGRFSSHSSS